MNAKRWIAIGLVVLLLFISTGFRFAMNVASGFFNDFTELFDTTSFEENIMLNGEMTERVAVLHLEGVIQGSEAFWGVGYDHEQFLGMIKQASEDPTVKAVILRVDSPGGGVLETEQIYNALKEMQDEYDTPYYVSMGNTAASGGYYVSAPADKIFAEPATLTGSIGVIMESVNFAGLAEKYGITTNTIKSGKHKDILSSTREMTDEEREILQSMVDEMYDEFVSVIVDGRQLTERKVRELADGRIYTGRQAQAVDLVDEVGDFSATLADLQEAYDLEDAQVIQYNLPFQTVSKFGLSLQNIFGSKDEDIKTILQLLQQSDKPRAMYIY